MIVLDLSLRVEEVELVDKRGYLTLSITLAKDGKVLLRKPEGIRDWFEDIKVREKRTTVKTFPMLLVHSIGKKTHATFGQFFY